MLLLLVIPVVFTIGKCQELQIVSKSEWGALPTTNFLDHPTPNVIISHTVTNSCLNKSECSSLCRFIQMYHIESRHWDDIAYNFLIGGDGLVYEGRAWDIVGAHTKEFNAKSIGIAFIGDFNKESPSENSLVALRSLLEEGVKNGKLAKEYKLLGQLQVSGGSSPGETLYNEIKKWDHWSEAI